MIYTSFNTWLEALKYRAKMFFGGIYGLLAYVLIMGIVSVILCVAKRLKRGFLRETFACGFLTACLFVASAGWFTTFVRERHDAVNNQHKADSLSYELAKFTQAYDKGELIVINGDTVNIKWK